MRALIITATTNAASVRQHEEGKIQITPIEIYSSKIDSETSSRFKRGLRQINIVNVIPRFLSVNRRSNKVAPTVESIREALRNEVDLPVDIIDNVLIIGTPTKRDVNVYIPGSRYHYSRIIYVGSQNICFK